MVLAVMSPLTGLRSTEGVSSPTARTSIQSSLQAWLRLKLSAVARRLKSLIIGDIGYLRFFISSSLLATECLH